MANGQYMKVVVESYMVLGGDNSVVKCLLDSPVNF